MGTATGLSIIEFAEQDVKVPLYPVQRVLLKLAYGLPLDGEGERFFVPKDWRSVGNKVGWLLTEKSYVEYLEAEGRLGGSFSRFNGDSSDSPVTWASEIFWALGRRGGKSYLGELIAAYEVLRLIQLGDPHKHYGMFEGARINVLTVGTDKDQTGMMYQMATWLARRSGLLSPYLGNTTLTYAGFQTPEDVRRYGAYRDNPQAKASIRMTYRSALSKGLCGSAAAAVVLDEFAYMEEGKAICWSVSPSLLRDGKLFVVSTPDMTPGSEFYQLWKGGLSVPGRQSVRVPTWELNPTIPLSFYQKMWESNPVRFGVEFGAEFVEPAKPEGAE